MFATAKSLGVAAFASNARERNRFGVSLPLIVALGLYALIISHASAVLGDPDTYWHITVGRWMVAHGAVPDHGVFSASMPNAPWVPQSWLAEILMAWVYDHFGWLGLAVGTALCEAGAMAVLLRALLGVLTPVHAMIATILASALLFPHILARPYILTMPILVVWVAALVRARSDNRAPSPWLALLIVLWANLHASYMFGIGLGALLAAEAVLLAGDWHARIRAMRDWGCFGALAVTAALITPASLEGLLFPINFVNTSALTYIAEWQGANFSQFQPLELWILSIFSAALLLGWRLPPARLGMLVLLLAMTLRHARYSELLGVVAPLLLAPALAPQLEARLGRRRVLLVDRVMAELAMPATGRGIMLTGAILLAVSAIALRGGNPHPSDAMAPAAAVAEVKAHHIEGHVFNSYQFGGYLIFSGIPPFIDGRAELYGDAFIKRYADAVLLTSTQLPELLDDYGITWTLLPSQTPAVILLDHLRGWRRLYADAVAVVHVRDNQPPH